MTHTVCGLCGKTMQDEHPQAITCTVCRDRRASRLNKNLRSTDDGSPDDCGGRSPGYAYWRDLLG